jgi:uncharacterized protein YyaL (SSP411 family)
MSTSQTPNRLIHEKSPYLLQHAYNPVDWYPWGPEALAKAKQEDKPIFLSIGYSTCHWCHVMERESFEHAEVAALMNEWFINIKVDREEHPDLDQVYMQAVTALTGHGGWPLTVFLTPELKPFFGGTYFPPERRWNVPGMKEVLPAVAEAWRSKRQDILTSADQLTKALNEEAARASADGTVSLQALDVAFRQAVAGFDPSHGGFGGSPKFPRSHELSFLLHYWARTRAAQALEIVTTTLDHLSRGGIHDHLGGGFHRYATDAQWLVPHFEKMLYDQALLARTYLEAVRITGRSDYAEVARGIFEYVLRDLRDPRGGFYSAEDADSEGEEGKFYVWTPQQVSAVLGEDDAEWFSRFYNVTAEGNFSAEGGSASGGEHHTSILNVQQPLEEFAKLKNVEMEALAARLRRARATLLEARSTRVRPHRDDKILTSWNGLMIASLAYGSAALQEPRYLEAAKHAADFVLATLKRDGGLLRRWRDGDARYAGTLEDYAFFAWGLLELYEASFDPRYLEEAKGLAHQMIERFWDSEGGGFFLRDRSQEPLIVSSKEVYDGATPSGNSIAALLLLRLGRLTADPSTRPATRGSLGIVLSERSESKDEERLEEIGRRTLETFAQTVERAPFGSPQLLIAWDFALGPSQEIVIAGEPADAATIEMVRIVHQRFLPRAVIAFHPTRGPDRQRIEALAPYLKAQEAIDGQPTAYVCERYVCQLPVTDLAKFTALLTFKAPHFLVRG